MAGKESPLNVGVIKEKIDKGQVKVRSSKGRKNVPQAPAQQKKEPRKVKGVNGAISDAEVIAYLKTQDSDVTSTQVRDALGFMSRTQARRVLRRLAKTKHINIGTRKVSDKRQIFTFGVA